MMGVKELAKPWIKDLVPYLPGETVPDTIKLASNENGWGPSPKAVQAIIEAASKVFRYPYRDLEVIDAIASYSGSKRGNIVLGNGSDELIDMVIKAFKGPVASHYPTFLEYHAFTKLYGMDYIRSPLNEDFSFDADRFLQDAQDANILFLCTPNNPTGTTISPADIEKVAES